MEFTLFLGVVFVAFVVQTSLGFGSSVITVALGAFLLPIETVVSSVIPIILLNVLYISLRHGRHIDWRVLSKRILPLMLVGLPVGLWVARAGPNNLLRMVFGVFLAIVSCFELYSLMRAAPTRRQLSTPRRAALLVAGGVMHGIYATGGPMAVYVASREIPDKSAFRSTLIFLWLLLDCVLLIGFFVDGTYTTGSWPKIAVLIAPLVVGSFVGERLHRRLNHVLFRKLVYVLLFASGVFLAVTG